MIGSFTLLAQDTTSALAAAGAPAASAGSPSALELLDKPSITTTLGRTTYHFARLQPYEQQPWLYLVLGAAIVAVLAYVVLMYRRDAVELKRPIAWLLLALRIGAFAAALFYFLGLEKRSERQVVHNSRVVLLVDTSQSMAEEDDTTGGTKPASGSTAGKAGESRLDEIVAEFTSGKLLPELRKTHDVLIARFDRDLGRIATLTKLVPIVDSTSVPSDRSEVLAAISAEKSSASAPVRWAEQLLPQGDETRLGTALRRLILEERNTPLAGIVILSDGAQNAGIEPAAVVELAAEAKIPVFTVGLGSDVRPANIRISDFIAPPRAFPGDGFTITGYVQPSNYGRSSVAVELYSRDASERTGPGQLEQTQRVNLGADNEIVPVKFELKSDKPGRRTYHLQLAELSEDHNAADNRQEADVEIIDRKTRVLLLASAATREYQFLRNQLQRDKDVIVDVFLQGAAPGISQDAHEILFEFPATKEALYNYDAIVAFDPDWAALDADAVKRDEMLDLIERWVAEEAGGLIAIAGPVHGDDLARVPELTKIRNLYPVTFQRRLSQLTDSQFGSTEPLPVQFTPDGRLAEFLWIADNSVQSQGAWAGFPGVYGYYDVKAPKPGATVYARVGESSASGLGTASLLTDEGQVYMAGQIYGSGRVFYLGSGEMWRLREYDEAYFERLYTKLIRHVSQGRLLRGSSRGVLLVERDRYRPGETVIVRAQLSDAQHEPLTLPTVTLQVTQPDTTTKAVSLAADENHKGMYLGQFSVLQEGSYRLDLPVPESVDDQLSRRFQVQGSNPERENSQRNNQLLSEIATGTKALYYRGLTAIGGSQGLPALATQLRDRSETITLTGAPDEAFQKRQMYWLMGLLCGCLCLEWLIRRLSKLA
jgi:hypothetical protein